MKNRFNKPLVLIVGLFLAAAFLFGALNFYNVIGVPNSQLEADFRSNSKIDPDQTIIGSVGASDTMAAFLAYPEDRSDHTFSVYVNRPGFSFGYFFRVGGDLHALSGVTAYTVEGCPGRAFFSMNDQHVARMEIDDGNSIQETEFDSDKPFVAVLPVNAGSVTFYDADGNTVEYYRYSL